MPNRDNDERESQKDNQGGQGSNNRKSSGQKKSGSRSQGQSSGSTRKSRWLTATSGGIRGPLRRAFFRFSPPSMGIHALRLSASVLPAPAPALGLHSKVLPKRIRRISPTTLGRFSCWIPLRLSL